MITAANALKTAAKVTEGSDAHHSAVEMCLLRGLDPNDGKPANWQRQIAEHLVGREISMLASAMPIETD